MRIRPRRPTVVGVAVVGVVMSGWCSAALAQGAAGECVFRGVSGLSVTRGATPDAYVISWNVGDVDGAALVFRSTNSDVPRIDDPIVVQPFDSSVTLGGLDPARRWYFDVVNRGETVTIAERRVPLQGALNFRDVGGYPAAGCRHVRWGQFFRTDALGGLTPADLDYLAAMQLSVVTDLRQDSEVAAAPDRLPPGTTYIRNVIAAPFDVRDVLAGRIHITLDFMIQVQQYIVDHNAATIAGIIGRIGEGPTPQAVHCTGGKDRAGVVSAILLAALGVPDDVIADDFTLSDLYLRPMLDRQAAILRAMGVPEESIQLMVHTPPVVITSMLDYIRSTYGSIDAYLAVGGLGADALAAVRARMLR